MCPSQPNPQPIFTLQKDGRSDNHLALRLGFRLVKVLVRDLLEVNELNLDLARFWHFWLRRWLRFYNWTVKLRWSMLEPRLAQNSHRQSEGCNHRL